MWILVGQHRIALPCSEQESHLAMFKKIKICFTAVKLMDM